MERRNEPTHVTHGSVLDDLGFSPEKAAILKMKAEFHSALLKSARSYTQKELQKLLKEPQPRVSEFLNGKIASVSFEKMTVYAFRLGAKPCIRLESARKHHKLGVRVVAKRKSTAAPSTKQLAAAASATIGPLLGRRSRPAEPQMPPI